MSARRLAGRVRRLEQRRAAASRFVVWFGSVDAFARQIDEGVQRGDYCPRDMPVVIEAVERWHRDGLLAR